MTIDEALKKGLLRITREEWQPEAYAELWKGDNGVYGPWATVKEEWVKMSGRDYPQILIGLLPQDGWEEYTGKWLDDS